MFTKIGRKVGVLTLTSLCLSASLALRPITSEAFSIAVISPPALVSEPVDKVKLENLKAYDVIVFIDASHSVSYTHLDVYKRQCLRLRRCLLLLVCLMLN